MVDVDQDADGVTVVVRDVDGDTTQTRYARRACVDRLR